MSINKMVTNRMFIVLMTIYFVYFLLPGVYTFPSGINKTVGWAWDMVSVFRYFEPVLWLLFFVGYGMLALFKFSTNKMLSVTHLILIFLSLIIASISNLQFEYIAIIGLFSLIIFSVNRVWAIRNRKNN